MQQGSNKQKLPRVLWIQILEFLGVIEVFSGAARCGKELHGYALNSPLPSQISKHLNLLPIQAGKNPHVIDIYRGFYLLYGKELINRQKIIEQFIKDAKASKDQEKEFKPSAEQTKTLAEAFCFIAATGAEQIFIKYFLEILEFPLIAKFILDFKLPEESKLPDQYLNQDNLYQSFRKKLPTVLSIAAWLKNPTLVRFLIENQCPVTLPDLHNATTCFNFNDAERFECMEHIVKKLTCEQLEHNDEKNRYAAVFYLAAAGALGALKQVKERGINLRATFKKANVLHIASLGKFSSSDENQLAVLKWLLHEEKFDITEKDANGFPALTFAARRAKTAAAKFLIEHKADATSLITLNDMLTNNVCYAIHEARDQQQLPEFIKFLLPFFNRADQPSLYQQILNAALWQAIQPPKPPENGADPYPPALTSKTHVITKTVIEALQQLKKSKQVSESKEDLLTTALDYITSPESFDYFLPPLAAIVSNLSFKKPEHASQALHRIFSKLLHFIPKDPYALAALTEIIRFLVLKGAEIFFADPKSNLYEAYRHERRDALMLMLKGLHTTVQCDTILSLLLQNSLDNQEEDRAALRNFGHILMDAITSFPVCGGGKYYSKLLASQEKFKDFPLIKDFLEKIGKKRKELQDLTTGGFVKLLNREIKYLNSIQSSKNPTPQEVKPLIADPNSTPNQFVTLWNYQITEPKQLVYKNVFFAWMYHDLQHHQIEATISDVDAFDFILVFIENLETVDIDLLGPLQKIIKQFLFSNDNKVLLPFRFRHEVIQSLQVDFKKFLKTLSSEDLQALQRTHERVFPDKQKKLESKQSLPAVVPSPISQPDTTQLLNSPALAVGTTSNPPQLPVIPRNQ